VQYHNKRRSKIDVLNFIVNSYLKVVVFFSRGIVNKIGSLHNIILSIHLHNYK